MSDAHRITLRRGTLEDGFATYRVLREAVNDLALRIGADPIPGDVESNYERIEPLFRHLTENAAEFWVAQDGTDRVVAYARSIEHGGFFELTEFFVLPEHQSAGIGRQLLERAFPDDRGDLRVIVATTDVRALSRYLKAGMTASTPILSLIGPPTTALDDNEGWGEMVTPTSPALSEIAQLDRAIAGFDRESLLPGFAETRAAITAERSPGAGRHQHGHDHRRSGSTNGNRRGSLGSRGPSAHAPVSCRVRRRRQRGRHTARDRLLVDGAARPRAATRGCRQV